MIDDADRGSHYAFDSRQEDVVSMEQVANMIDTFEYDCGECGAELEGDEDCAMCSKAAGDFERMAHGG